MPTPADRYTPTARWLHALLGLALVGVFAMGLYMTSLPFSPQRLKLYNWHKWAAMLGLASFFEVREYALAWGVFIAGLLQLLLLLGRLPLLCLMW